MEKVFAALTNMMILINGISPLWQKPVFSVHRTASPYNGY